MDLPQPPQDTDLRNIIDKLAQFVARNGPEFEQMTKSKQKNNPKFSFLYGGEYFNYYQYKVTTEQAILKQSSNREESGYSSSHGGFSSTEGNGGGGWGGRGSEGGGVSSLPVPPPPPQLIASNSLSPAVLVINAQQAVLNEQIKQSQSNLNAQHSSLIQQQQTQMEETVATAQTEMIQRLATESLIQQQQTQMEETVATAQTEMIQRLATEANISLTDFDNILQPIIESCTKDSISTGKGWILNHATTYDAGAVIAQYLLKKLTTNGSTFTQKLHIIYLVNDVLHHCARKNADDLKKNLENVVVPMFCNASIAITEDQETKLNKLLKLWESKSNYFDSSVIEKMKSPTTSYQEYQASLISLYANLITPLTQATKSTFENYQKQHQAFVTHTLQQIQQLEMQKQVLNSQMSSNNNTPDPASNANASQNNIPIQNQQQNVHFGSNNFTEQNFNQQSGQFQNNQSMTFEPPEFCSTNNQPLFPMIDQSSSNNYGTPNGSQGSNENNLYDFEQNYHIMNSNLSLNDHGDEPMPSVPSINLSLPPPGFFNEKIPPGFGNGLPDLSKPPPGFANIPEVCPEDLMPSVPYFELPAGLMVPLIMLEDSDYKPLDPESIRLPPPAPPSDRLLAAVKAFYSKPNHTRPQDSEGWEKLGLYEYYRAKNAVRKQKEDDIKNGLREKSRSPTPIKYDILNVRSPPARRYRSKSRSPSRERSKSKSPPPIRISSPERGGRRSRISRRSPTPPSSSPPPSFMSTPSSFANPNELSELDPSNKGHQMLRRMGWGQGGLGSAGQGIAAPINAGAVRDRQDQYKGVGVNLNDPYENFRKNKGAAFITRMKERALERA